MRDYVRCRTKGGRLVYTRRVVPLLLATGTLSMPDRHDPRQNNVLAALSTAERERLFPHLQLVAMPLEV